MNPNFFPSATELIRNEDGSVYHLGLHPDDIADRILLVGDPDRVQEVTMHWDRVELERSRREFVTQTGWLGSQRLTVCSTGIGTDNVDIVMHELDALRRLDWTNGRPLERVRPLTLVRIGTAGCLQEGIEEGQVMVSSAALSFDGLLAHYRVPIQEDEQALGQAAADALYGPHPPAQPSAVSADPEWLQRMHNAGLPSGINWTCAGFYGPQGRNLHGWSTYPDLLSKAAAFRTVFGGRLQGITHLEMETAGLYGLSRLMGHRAVSVSALLAHRLHQRFCPEPKAVMQACIQKVLKTLEDHPENEDHPETEA